MRGKTKIIISIIIAAIVIPLAIYTISPLFLSNVVNEPDPTLAISEFQKYMNLSEEERIEVAKNMTREKAMMIGIMAAKQNTTVDENVTFPVIEQTPNNTLTGTFIGIGDGFHNVEGAAKVIPVESGAQILRLENFKATNGPDLYVYLSNDKSASDFINVGRLKGNVGNQNYEIPIGSDLSKYNTVLIWCRAFSFLFGSAQIS
ncbi:MAG: DM13 domain-containing protein [Nitrososphaeraceae archaeon]|nr:DM13 domain-containing protein [Nitrososphaeraceae archaeon]